MPQLPSVVKGTDASTVLPIISDVAVGSSTVTINSDGYVKKGAFFKFSNHDKLYLLTSEVLVTEVITTDVFGNTTVTYEDVEQEISFFPPLQTAVTTAHTVRTGEAVQFSYYRDLSNAQGITFTDGILSSPGTISLIEAL